MAVTLSYRMDADGPMAVLDALPARVDDLTELMDAVGAVLEDSARGRITSSNTAPDGAAWPKSLRAQQQGGPTLLESGRLQDSLTRAVERRQVEIGTNLIYAATHQFGAEIRAKDGGALHFQLPNGEFVTVGKVVIPARPYLGVSEADEEDILDQVDLYVSEALQ